MSRVRIGDWTLDAQTGTLRSASGVVRLEPKVQAVLQLLIDHAGTVVSQETLLTVAWEGTHVAPGALTRTISILRNSLGDDVRAPRYIETVPKRGYLLIAPVDVLHSAAAPRIPEGANDPIRSGPWMRRVALAAATLAMALWMHHDVRPMMKPVGGFEFPHETRIGNETAYEHYTRAVTLNPNSANAHAGLATVYVFRASYMPDRDHWTAAAMAAAQRAAALDPASSRVMRALGMAHAQAGRLRDAAESYRRALAIEPSDGTTSTNLGMILMSEGRVAEALEQFQRHAALQPGSPYPYANLANGLAVAGYVRESVEAAEAALAIEPLDLNAQLTLVRIDLMRGAYTDAASRLTRLLQGHPSCATCVVQLGLIDQLNGRLVEAAERYRAALVMAPQHGGAGLRLAQVAALRGEHREAERVLQDVERSALETVERGSEWSGPLWQLAVAAAVRNDRQTALQRYQQAVAAGRRDAPWDRWDPLLSALHPEPAFLAAQAPADRERRAALPVVRRLSLTLRGAGRPSKSMLH